MPLYKTHKHATLKVLANHQNQGGYCEEAFPFRMYL
jgi:hypothetical protein